MSDLISRQAAIDALNGLVNRFEQLLRDIRESKVDDSVCGLCEHDGAYIGQSGDWFNECPGFDKDDCFKLSDDCRKRWLKEANLPSAQPIQTASNYLQSLPTSPLLVGKMPSAQPDCSLWFRIGELCVNESKGDITAEVAIEKIRELLREAERREE